MARGTYSAAGFMSTSPLPLCRGRREDFRQVRVTPATCRAVPVAVIPAAVGRASAGTCSLLLAVAVSAQLLSVTPVSAAALDDGQAIFEKSCAAYVV